MSESANPTSAGIWNHFNGPAAPARICDLLIEDGHGCLPVEKQLAAHLQRILVSDGRDACRALIERLLVADGVSVGALNAELVARGLKAAPTRSPLRLVSDRERENFDQALPSGGKPN